MVKFNIIRYMNTANPLNQSPRTIYCALTPTSTPTHTPTHTPTPTQTLTSTPTPVCSSPPSSLLSWWPAEGNANDGWTSNQGILMNGTTFDSGKVGRAFRFDSVVDYVDIGDRPALETAGGYSVDAWVLISTPGTSQAILTKYREDTDGDGWSLMFYPNATVEAIVKSSNGAGMIVTSPQTITDGYFHHLGMTWNTAGGTLKLYVDGILAGQSNALSGVYSGNSRNVMIGRRNGPNNEFRSPFAGQIDEVDFFLRELTLGEIQAIYHAGSFGKCRPYLSDDFSVSRPDLWAYKYNGGNISYNNALVSFSSNTTTFPYMDPIIHSRRPTRTPLPWNSNTPKLRARAQV